MAFLNTLQRDGTGDFDRDGRSDRDEWLAGLDPTIQAVVFTVFVLYSVADGSTQLIWTAVPGKGYAVEFKDSLSDSGWRRLPEPVSIHGTLAMAIDHSAPSPHRFYRALLRSQ